MKTYTLAAAVLVALASPALALQDCKPGKEDKRICDVDYSPNNVLRVWGTLRSMTMFVFGPGETNPRMAAADMNVLTFIPDGNIAIIKPKPVPTPAWHIQPIVLLTTLADGSVRPYQLEYDLLDQGPITADSDVTQFAVHYHYPGDAAKIQAAAWRARQAQMSEQQVKAKLATTGPGSAAGSGGMDCNYLEEHDPKKPTPTFIPPHVCDDGQATYVYFPGNMPVPAITVDGPDGKPMVPMQNFDTAGSYQVVHMVAQHLYLRIGDALDCIWRAAPVDPVGHNSGTNTSSPQVVRELKEATTP